jgi:serine/threonine protein kinase
MAAIDWPRIHSQVRQYHLDGILCGDPTTDRHVHTIIYLGRNVEEKSRFAIKCCYITSANESMIRNEVLLMQQHPSIWTVPLLDYFEESSFGFLILPYYEHIGYTVFEYEKEIACDVSWDLINAIHHLHSSRVWHRDVNISNFFIGPYSCGNDECELFGFLGDFGLAFRDEDGLQLPPVGGTDGYLAPELIRKEIC